MMKGFRTAALAMSVVGLLAGSGTGIGAADARPVPATAVAFNGTNHVYAASGNCSGMIRVALYTDTTKPGRLTVKLTPERFTRSCTVRPWIGWGTMGVDQYRVPVKAGPRGGPTVTRTIRTGPGLISFSVGNRSTVSAISYFVWVP